MYLFCFLLLTLMQTSSHSELNFVLRKEKSIQNHEKGQNMSTSEGLETFRDNQNILLTVKEILWVKLLETNKEEQNEETREESYVKVIKFRRI